MLKERAYARLVRFYGVGSDPGWPERTPRRLLLALLRQLPVLAAREMLELKTLVAYPHLRNEDQQVLNADLMARAFPEPVVKRPARKVVREHDPVKAAEWFRAMGVRVRVSGEKVSGERGEGEKRGVN